MTHSAILLSVVAALALSCTAQAPVEPVDLEAVESALIEADEAWADAYASADDPAGAFVAELEDDARLLPPDAPLAVGKEAIRNVIEELEAMPGFHVEWEPNDAVVSDGGDFGYTIGSYQMEFDGPDGSPVNIEGKYLTVWRQQADGSWKVTADMFNANAPPAAPEE